LVMLSVKVSTRRKPKFFSISVIKSEQERESRMRLGSVYWIRPVLYDDQTETERHREGVLSYIWSRRVPCYQMASSQFLEEVSSM
jgi:hypothetical protein